MSGALAQYRHMTQQESPPSGSGSESHESALNWQEANVIDPGEKEHTGQ